MVTDQLPKGDCMAETGIIDSGHNERRRGSAVTTYTEDFEVSETEGSQTSFHLSFTRSNRAENEKMKQNANNESSVSTHSQGSSVSTEKPVRSSRSPVKTKSRRLKTNIEVTESVERKFTISQEDYNISADQAPRLERRPVALKNLKKNVKEATQMTFTLLYLNLKTVHQMLHLLAASMLVSTKCLICHLQLIIWDTPSNIVSSRLQPGLIKGVTS